MKKSLMYYNIPFYRFVMNLLYLGKYKERFSKVINILEEEDKSVLELCFGDLIVAKYCKDNNKAWKGIDMNPVFIANAQKEGLNVEQADIIKCEILPKSDACIMIGSLYHFAGDFKKIFTLMLQSAPKIIISEPTTNLSHYRGLIGFLAKKCTNTGKGREEFRFTEASFSQMLGELSRELTFNYRVVNCSNRDTCVVIRRR